MAERSDHNIIDNIIDCEFAYINKEQSTSVLPKQISHDNSHPKIVLVEDNKLIQSYVISALEIGGYDIYPFDDAESSIPFFQEYGRVISVAIIDDVLPTLHGHELIKKIKPYIPDTKIILTSGYYSDDCRAPLTDPQVACFLHKPYNLKNLLDTVQALCVSPRPASGL